MLKSQENERASIKEVIVIGAHLAKNVFQLHARRRTGR